MKVLQIILVSFLCAFSAVSKISMPTDYSSIASGTRANLKANFDETQTKFNPAADSIDEVRGRMSGYTGEFTLSSLDNLRLRLDTDGSSVARFYVTNGYTSDSLFRVSEDSTWRVWGAGVGTKLTLSDSILAATARISGNGTFGGTLGVTGASTIAALSATTGTFSSTLGVTGASTLAALSATTGSFSSTLTVTGSSTIGALLTFGANSRTTYENTTTPSIYATGSAGGAYPFLGAGNLVLEPRLNGAVRDVVVMGSSATPSMIVTGGGTVSFNSANYSSGRVPMFSTSGLIAQDNLYWDATNDRLGVGSGASSPATDFDLTKGTAGTATVGRIYHTDNTNTSSNAILQLFSGGASGGDPFVRFNINGATDWSIGPDNSDADALVITPSTTPGGATNGLRISTAGAVTMPGTLGVTGAVSTGALTATTATLGGGEAFTYGDTSFTLTATGMTTSPTGTAYAVRVGNQVTITIPYITGTSNSTSFSLTSIPTGWRPTRAVNLPYSGYIDNGVSGPLGFLIILTNGTITLGTSTSTAGWTNSGTKAIGQSILPQDVCVTYQLQ